MFRKLFSDFIGLKKLVVKKKLEHAKNSFPVGENLLSWLIVRTRFPRQIEETSFSYSFFELYINLSKGFSNCNKD